MAALDEIDRHILRELRRNGRISILDLADRVGLSPTPCGRRVKRLEDDGVIRGYTATLDNARLGLNISVFIMVRLSGHGPEGTRDFLSAVAARPEITECFLVAGNVDYMLRVWVGRRPRGTGRFRAGCAAVDPGGYRDFDHGSPEGRTAARGSAILTRFTGPAVRGRRGGNRPAHRCRACGSPAAPRRTAPRGCR